LTYYSEITALRDELITRLQEITWLSGRIYKGKYRTVSSYPVVFLQTTRDDPELAQSSRPYYYINPQFNLIYQVKSTGNQETDEGVLVSGVGAIFDKVKTYTTNHPKWERVEVESIDLGYESPGIPSKVLKEAHISLRFRKGW